MDEQKHELAANHKVQLAAPKITVILLISRFLCQLYYFTASLWKDFLHSGEYDSKFNIPKC